MRLLNDPIFMDIEASSLDSGSFPIEIAWVDSSGHGESYLISPRFNWKGWSAASEKLHGISQSMLDSEGIPATTAAQLVYDTLHDRLIYSDNAAFDAYWLGMLLDLIGQPPLEVKEFDKLRTSGTRSSVVNGSGQRFADAIGKGPAARGRSRCPGSDPVTDASPGITGRRQLVATLARG